MKLKSSIIALLFSVACATSALAAIPKAPERAPAGSLWYLSEGVGCTQGSRLLVHQTYIRKNSTTIERIDHIAVDGVRFWEAHRVLKDGELLVEEIYIRSSAKGAWMFYGPIEEWSALDAKNRALKAMGIDANGQLTCKNKE